MSLYISNPLEMALMIDVKLLNKFRLDDAIQYANYMNNVHCMYVAGWVPRKAVFEELSPQKNKLTPIYKP